MFARIADFDRNSQWTDLVHRHLGQMITDVGLSTCDAKASVGAVDLAESGQAFILTADVPGMKADDIDLSLDQRRLNIRAERSLEKSDEYRAILSERRNIALQRTLILPKAVDADHISATVTDGVLTITLPKSAEVTPRKIKVNS